MTMDRIVFRTGKKTLLVLPEEKDERQFACWINDYDTAQFLGVPRSMSLVQEHEFLTRILKNRDKEEVFCLALHSGEIIGMMGLHNINLINRTAVTGAYIGNPKYRSGGYGSDAKMQLLYYAFVELGLRKVNSSALGTNKRSIAYLEKTGYKVWGVNKKECFRGGKIVDQVHLAVTKEDFMPLWRGYSRS
ncbi:GNAT family N-acetyltransferase [Candidatus Parcubacteria bacterium]|nr:GNAT family N-acetyltransferase [Candidatus Parcubacteria bacterium]